LAWVFAALPGRHLRDINWKKRLQQQENRMNRTFKATALALTLVGATSLSALAVDVTFNSGDVAYGYTDGYWTTKREWRTWEKPEYVEVYRKSPGARYYEYRHDRDPDMGWRGEVRIGK